MSKFVLVASRRQAPEGKLNFLSTQTPQAFAKDYCDEGTKVKVIKNPNGNNHPGGLFISWTQDGQTFNGSVSHKLVTPEDFKGAKLVLSIVSSPEAPEDYRVLLHTQAELTADNVVAELG